MPVLPYLAAIEKKYGHELADTFRAIVQELDLIAQKTGVGGNAIKAPPDVRSITVTAADGVFDIAITDPEGARQPSLGIHYFLEWDTDPSFSNSKTEDIGPARNERIFLGNRTFYWRVFSQGRNSIRSNPIVFGGSSPTGVAGGGALAGPTPQTSQGSGGAGAGGGFGGGK